MDEPVARTPAGTWRTLLKAGVMVGVAALVALLAWALLAQGKGRSLVAQIAAGERPPAPAFQLEVIWNRADTWPSQLSPALADGRLALHELRGYPLVLNVWASWCIPCREEAPILAASALAHQDEVVLLGVDVQDLRGDAIAFLEEFDVPYVSVRDRDDDVYDAYGLTGVPETYYIDAHGRITAHTPGPITPASLEQGIQTAQGGER